MRRIHRLLPFLRKLKSVCVNLGKKALLTTEVAASSVLETVLFTCMVAEGCQGPNWVHSLDGHDKLMGYQNSTFPLAIYGCLDSQ